MFKWNLLSSYKFMEGIIDCHFTLWKTASWRTLSHLAFVVYLPLFCFGAARPWGESFARLFFLTMTSRPAPQIMRFGDKLRPVGFIRDMRSISVQVGVKSKCAVFVSEETGLPRLSFFDGSNWPQTPCRIASVIGLFLWQIFSTQTHPKLSLSHCLYITADPGTAGSLDPVGAHKQTNEANVRAVGN